MAAPMVGGNSAGMCATCRAFQASTRRFASSITCRPSARRASASFAAVAARSAGRGNGAVDAAAVLDTQLIWKAWSDQALAMRLVGADEPFAPFCSIVGPFRLPLGSFGFSFECERWSRLTGQNGGLAKVDSGFDYAANFSSVACVA